jgi:hypothetical protein
MRGNAGAITTNTTITTIGSCQSGGDNYNN